MQTVFVRDKHAIIIGEEERPICSICHHVCMYDAYYSITTLLFIATSCTNTCTYVTNGVEVLHNVDHIKANKILLLNYASVILFINNYC
jgi:hypothetical protein